MDENIGSRFKNLRKNILKLKQPDLCEILGITNRATMSNWETNRAQPPIKYLQIISENFNINLHWLLTGEGRPYSSSTIKGEDIEKRQHNNFSNINISNKDSVYNKINANSLRKSHVVKKENIQQLLELANLKKEG